MEITIQHEHEMSALQRKDYLARVFHQGATPDRKKLRIALAKQLKADESLVVVRQIKSVFGSSASIVEVSVYKDADALKSFEAAYVVKRHGGEEAPKEGDA